MEELVMIGFAEKLRAIEVLAQLQRLKFDWAAELRTAVAVEVERDGRLRLYHNQLLDPASGSGDLLQWKAILNAIIPLPPVPPESTAAIAFQTRFMNADENKWLRDISLEQDFIRNAAALLRPGNSAILAILHDTNSALKVLSGYSQVVLHSGFAGLHRTGRAAP